MMSHLEMKQDISQVKLESGKHVVPYNPLTQTTTLLNARSSHKEAVKHSVATLKTRIVQIVMKIYEESNRAASIRSVARLIWQC